MYHSVILLHISVMSHEKDESSKRKKLQIFTKTFLVTYYTHQLFSFSHIISSTERASAQELIWWAVNTYKTSKKLQPKDVVVFFLGLAVVSKDCAFTSGVIGNKCCRLTLLLTAKCPEMLWTFRNNSNNYPKSTQSLHTSAEFWTKCVKIHNMSLVTLRLWSD